MKTYTKTVEVTKPRLEVVYDQDSESPREWSNLGYFITCDSRHGSPDKKDIFEKVVKETGDEANSQAEHIDLIKKWFAENAEQKVLAIFPIVKYEHSGVSYSLGTVKGFDYSNNGFYIITDKTQKELGTPKASFEKVIGQELEVYNKWLDGEVYGFRLYDEQGNEVDSCYGFYDLEDIREHLPKEWKDEDLTKYITD